MLTTIEKVSDVVNTAVVRTIETRVFVSRANSRGYKLATQSL